MSRPDTCPAQPTTDQDDRGDTYKGRTRGPVYSDKRSGVSKRPRRHLSARRRTRGSDGNPRRVWASWIIEGDTDLLEELPVDGFSGAGKSRHPSCPNEQQAAGDTFQQKATLVTIDVQLHQWSSASGRAARAQTKKRQSGDVAKGSKTTQVPNCCRMINSLGSIKKR